MTAYIAASGTTGGGAAVAAAEAIVHSGTFNPKSFQVSNLILKPYLSTQLSLHTRLCFILNHSRLVNLHPGK